MQLSGCFVCYFRHWQNCVCSFDLLSDHCTSILPVWGLGISFSSVWCHSMLKRCVQTSIGNEWCVILHFVFHFVQFCCVTIYCCKMVKLVAYIEMKILYCLFICMHVCGTLAIVVIRDFSLNKLKQNQYETAKCQPWYCYTSSILILIFWPWSCIAGHVYITDSSYLLHFRVH